MRATRGQQRRCRQKYPLSRFAAWLDCSGTHERSTIACPVAARWPFGRERGDLTFHGYRATPAQRPRPSDRLMQFSSRGRAAVSPLGSRQASRSERPSEALRRGSVSRSARSLAPEILKARRRQLGVADSVLDGPMPEPILNGARVVALVGKRVAAAVAEHVSMYREGKPARSPMRLISRLTASGVNGPPRSVAKTKPLSGNCRRSSRSARISSPRSG